MNHVGMQRGHQALIVAIVDRHADQHRAVNGHRLFQHGFDLVGRTDLQAPGAHRFGELHDVDRPESHTRFATVGRHLLETHHVVGAVDPHEMHEVALEPHRRLELDGGEQEAAVARHRDDFTRGIGEAGRDRPGQCDAQRLLAIADQDLPRPVRDQVARHPDVEGARSARAGRPRSCASGARRVGNTSTLRRRFAPRSGAALARP